MIILVAEAVVAVVAVVMMAMVMVSALGMLGYDLPWLTERENVNPTYIQSLDLHKIGDAIYCSDENTHRGRTGRLDSMGA